MNSLPITAWLLLGCLVCSLGCGQLKQIPPVVRPPQQRTGTTTERICAIAAELMSVDRAKVTGQTTLADLAADELDFVELVMEMEEEFDVSIPDEAIEKLTGTKEWAQGTKNVTLDKLAALVEEQKKLSASGSK